MILVLYCLVSYCSLFNLFVFGVDLEIYGDDNRWLCFIILWYIFLKLYVFFNMRIIDISCVFSLYFVLRDFRKV